MNIYKHCKYSKQLLVKRYTSEAKKSTCRAINNTNKGTKGTAIMLQAWIGLREVASPKMS